MHQAHSKFSKTPQRVIFPEAVQFPKSWKWFMDQNLPQWVKDRYSPRESWKGKPFSREDAHFFFKGIEELSEIFTQERGRALQRYFEHPRFRSSYLLYFLPLQAAKFVTVLNRHEDFLLGQLKKSEGVFRLADLGAGPCTASIAFLLWLLDRCPEGQALPKIEIHAVDTQGLVLKEGAELIELITNSFPRLRNQVRVSTESAKWQDWARSTAKSETRWDLMLLGHVLNEGRDRQLQSWCDLYSRAGDAGILAIEPASKGASQGLSVLRDQIFQNFDPELRDEDSAYPDLHAPSLVGPCPHIGACPLSEGADWCHFSFPAQVPGEWFTYFSKGLGSERQWLKFSYLWMTPKKMAPTQLPLLVSDALTKRGTHSAQGRTTAIEALVCKPENTEKVSLQIPLEKLRGPLGLRGGWLAVGKSNESAPKTASARPSKIIPKASAFAPRKKDSAGSPKGTSRKGRPIKKGN